ncbi:MAG: CoB--CoM heterodisulfide reductase iron-sulfur subunit B family protein [Candidatus Thorarchaeota archaeon]
MKEYVLFRGCVAPVRLPAYEAATMIVLEKLGISVTPLNDVNCCGAQYIESLNEKAFLALGGRILALAEKEGKDVLVICGACAGSLKYTKRLLDRRKLSRSEVNSLLAKEGLEYSKKVEVKHLLDVFEQDISAEIIRSAITNPYAGIKLAAHYGCHVTRPFKDLNATNVQAPKIIDTLIRAAGGQPIDYPEKMRCCGAPLLSMDESLAGKVGLEKIRNARDSGAEGIVTACAYCEIQLSQVQFSGRLGRYRIPVLTLPQFLGPALGILDEDLGMHMNRTSPSRILESLSGVRY